MADSKSSSPKQLEHFLTKEYANKYNERWYGFRWLWTEMTGDETALSKQLNRDIVRYNKFRQEISVALSERPDTLAVAERWIYLLKPRIERLDFWANLWGAVLPVFIAGLGIYALIWGTTKIGEDLGIRNLMVGLSLATSFFIGMYKFDIERKKLWYKYVLSHMEAISKVESHRSEEEKV
jgi:hypothetical protein